MNAFARPKVATMGHARFEIDDTGIGQHAIELPQGISPDVGWLHGPRDVAVRSFGELYVLPRVTYVRLLDARRIRVRQNLVNPSASHHVAADEQRDRCSRRHLASPACLRWCTVAFPLPLPSSARSRWLLLAPRPNVRRASPAPAGLACLMREGVRFLAHHLSCGLVGSQANIARMSQLAVSGPFGKRDFGYE